MGIDGDIDTDYGPPSSRGIDDPRTACGQMGCAAPPIFVS